MKMTKLLFTSQRSIFFPIILTASLVSSGCKFEVIKRVFNTSDESPPAQATVFETVEKPGQTQARMVLPNGLEVLMISSPKFQKASAAMAIPVGFWSDPQEHQGLAHYLEHMLFQGTEDFPVAGEYFAYLAMNGGSANAYTSTDLTNYMFEVNLEALDGALHRFSQFFTSPTLNPENSEREKNIVHSEYRGTLQNDSRRLARVLSILSPEGHPSRQLGVGSLATLANTDVKVLRDFYEKHYSADTMKLVVMSPDSVSDLRSRIEKYFSAVPNRQKKDIVIRHEPQDGWKTGQWIEVKTLMDYNSLRLSFQIPTYNGHWKTKPEDLLTAILGAKGKGSLLSDLKRDDFAIDVSVGTDNMADSGIAEGRLSISISLTDLGSLNKDKVIEYVFAYIGRIKRSGMKDHTFNENQIMAKLGYENREIKNDADEASEFARQMLYHPALAIEERILLLEEQDNQLIQGYIDRLTPDNLNVVFLSQKASVDKTENFYGTEYSIRPIENSKKSLYWNSFKTDRPSQNYPEPNEYIPSKFTIHKDEPTLTPYALDQTNDALGKLWFFQETSANTGPKGFLTLRIFSQEQTLSAKDFLLHQLYMKAIEFSATENLYMIRKAGYSTNFVASRSGIEVNLQGYSDAFAEVVGTLLSKETMMPLHLSDGSFNALKENMKRELASHEHLNPLNRLFGDASYFQNSTLFRNEDLRGELTDLTKTDLLQFVSNFYNRIYVDGLVYGNLKSADFSKTIEDLHKIENSAPLDQEKVNELVGQDYLLPPQKKFAYAVTGPNNNNAIVKFVDTGLRTPENVALTALTKTFVDEPYFTELRSHQMLGYSVQAGSRTSRETTRLFFLIQSEDFNGETLVERSDKFLDDFTKGSSALVDANFENNVKGVISSLEQRPTDMSSRFSEFFQIIAHRNANWNYYDEIIEAVKKITPDQLKEFIVRVLTPANQARMTLYYYAKGEAPPAPAAGEVLVESRQDFDQKRH